jgi:hypothetical protein
MFLSKIMCVVVVCVPHAGYFCSILDFTTHNINLISRHALSPIPRCSHVHLSDIPRGIRQPLSPPSWGVRRAAGNGTLWNFPAENAQRLLSRPKPNQGCSADWRRRSDNRAVPGGRRLVTGCMTKLVDMSHDWYGSYWKLTAVWGADGKCKCGVVKLCCENACKGNRAWLVHGLRCFYVVSCNESCV